MGEGTSRSAVANVVASLILLVGIGGLFLLVYLFIFFDCLWEGTCGARENSLAVIAGIGAAGLFGFAMWRIWRR
jgi:hypothetical protein